MCVREQRADAHDSLVVCGYTGLFCRNIGVFRRYIGLMCVREERWAHVCEGRACVREERIHRAS